MLHTLSRPRERGLGSGYFDLLDLRVRLRALPFFADLRPLDLRDDDLREVDVRPLDLRDDARRVDFFADLRDDAFFFGTLPPARRASDNPMAIACLRLLTF